MIPISEKRKLETFGNVPKENNTFRVKQSKEMFKLLSNAIYSDKILAVIRELSANAIDAHVMAGNQETPIEVHLPNDFEPFFYVKDFGTGLSKEDVLNLYTTYGESTKTQDNLTTGAFGIGSKVGFAYTDQFTVTSRFEGTKIVYNCYISEDGMPMVSPVSEAPTDDPNGLEIYFAVSKGDFREFRNKAEQIYKYYLVTPNVVGSADFHVKPPEITLEMNLPCGVKVLLTKGNHAAKAVQGSCVYPINRETFVSSMGIEYTDTYLGNLLSESLLLEFPIGSLNITASREGLEYDKHTCSVIYQVLKELKVEMLKEIKEQFKDIKVKWYASLKRDEIYSSLKNPKVFSNEVVWNGLTMDDFLRWYCEIEFKETVPKVDSTGITRKITNNYAEVKYYSKSWRGGVSIDSSNWSQSDISISPRKHSFVIVVNTERKKAYRPLLKHNFSEPSDKYKDLEKLYYVLPNKGYEDRVFKEIKKTFKGIDEITIIKMCDLDEPPKAARKKYVKKKIQVLGKTRGFWIEEEKDVKNGGIYVDTFRGVPNGYSTTDNLYRFISVLKEHNVMPENVKIYGLPPNQKDVPKNNDRWMPLDEFLEKRFSKVLDGVDIEAVQKVRFERNVIRMNHSSTLELIKAYKDKSKSFQEICDHVDTLNSQNMDTLMEIVRVYEEWKQRKGEEVTITEIQNDKTDFEKLLTTLKERYKLFFEYGVDKSEYNKTYRKSQIEMFEEYVEMVDAFENLKKTPKKGTENDRLQ